MPVPAYSAPPKPTAQVINPYGASPATGYRTPTSPYPAASPAAGYTTPTGTTNNPYAVSPAATTNNPYAVSPYGAGPATGYGSPPSSYPATGPVSGYGTTPSSYSPYGNSGCYATPAGTAASDPYAAQPAPPATPVAGIINRPLVPDGKGAGPPVTAPKRKATVADIVALTRADVDEELVIHHIRTHGLATSLQASDATYLQQQGVSRNVIEAMRKQSTAATDKDKVR